MPRATFDRIDAGKKARLLRVAAKEFAANGFHKANVNTIAEKAGIAKGAIYTYFESKHDLYLAALAEGTRVLGDVMDEVSATGGSVKEQLRRLFLRGLELLDDNAAFLQMYCDLFTAGSPSLPNGLAETIEARSVSFYSTLLADGKLKGEVRADLQLPATAFLIDTVYVMFFAAAVSAYQGGRASAFGIRPSSSTGWLKSYVEPVLEFILRGIAPAEPRR